MSAINILQDSQGRAGDRVRAMDTTAQTNGAEAVAPAATGSHLRDGLRDIAPVMIAAFPIGALFGALSVAKGLSVAESVLMSVFVFAGGAQFSAMELWTLPVPVAALAFSTLLVNARHVLMGASLAPKLQDFSLSQRFAAAFFLTDEAWALAERRGMAMRITPAYWVGTACFLPFVWTGSTLLGAWLGTFVGDPAAVGADFAFTALFIGLVAGFWKGSQTGWTVAAAGIASAVVYTFFGPPWHVAAGAFAGIAAAYLAAGPQDQEDAP
jgi:4-azaleucine resistance transporter AzlC